MKKNIFISQPDGMCTILRLQMHKICNYLSRDEHCRLVSDPSQADISIVGTCAAFDADEARSVAMINAARQSGDHAVYAYGCMCSANPGPLKSDKKFRTWDVGELVSELTAARIEFEKDDLLPDEFRSRHEYRVYDRRLRFLGITFGCSFECTYCPHKLGVGQPFSFSMDRILTRMKAYSRNPEVQTLYLTGTDTACYNDAGRTFADLLKAVLRKARPDLAIKISQFNPEGLFYNEKLLLTSLGDSRVAEFQLPIQTSSPRLLQIMNRRYNPERVGAFVRSVKATNPDIYMRTDLLVGFPTETEQELEESIAFAIEYFDEIAVYRFEMKAGTPLSRMGLETIAREQSRARYRSALEKLQAAGKSVHSGGQRIESLFENDRQKKDRNRNHEI